MEHFMEQAFVEARAAQSIGEVPVGCVFIYKNKIIASGSNFVNKTKNATRHAEFVCIDKVFDFCSKNSLNAEEVFPEISVVVTVEPCIMCASALNNLGIKEIIFGCANDRFGGTTVVNVEKYLERKIPIKGGVQVDRAMQLLKDFYKGENPSAPAPKLKRL